MMMPGKILGFMICSAHHVFFDCFLGTLGIEGVREKSDGGVVLVSENMRD